MNSNTSLLTYLRSSSDIQQFLSQYSSNQLKPVIKASLLYGIYALRAMYGNALPLELLEAHVKKAKDITSATALIPNIKQKLADIRKEVNHIDSSLDSKHNPLVPNSNDLALNSKPEETQTQLTQPKSPKSRPQSAPPRKMQEPSAVDWRYDPSVFRKDQGLSKNVPSRTLLFRDSSPPGYRQANYSVMYRCNDDFGRHKPGKDITKEIYPEWWLGLTRMDSKDAEELPKKITQRDPPPLPPKHKVKKEIFTQTHAEKDTKPVKTVRIEETLKPVHKVDITTETDNHTDFTSIPQSAKRISFVEPDYKTESFKENYGNSEGYEDKRSVRMGKYEEVPEEYAPIQYLTSPKEMSQKKMDFLSSGKYEAQEELYRKPEYVSSAKEENIYRKSDYPSSKYQSQEELPYIKTDYSGNKYEAQQDSPYRKPEYLLPSKEEPVYRKSEYPSSKYETTDEHYRKTEYLQSKPQTLECIEKPMPGDKTVKEDKASKQLKDDKTVRYQIEPVYSNYSGWVGDFSDVVKHRPSTYDKEQSSYRYSDDKKLRGSDHSSRSEYRDSSGYESSREKKFMFPAELKPPRSVQEPSSNSASSMSMYHPTDDMKRFYAKEFTQLLESHGINSLDSTGGRKEEYNYLRPTRTYADEDNPPRNRREHSFNSQEHSPFL